MENMNYKNVCEISDKVIDLLKKETNGQQELMTIILSECQNRCEIVRRLSFTFQQSGKAIKTG